MVGLIICGAAIATFLRDPVLAVILLWVFEVFNGSISAAFGYFSSTGGAIRQADEVLVLLLVVLTVWRAMRTNTRVPPLRFILPCIGVALFGMLGAILHGVPYIVILLGAWLGLKLWIIIGVTLLLPWKPSDLTRVYSVFTKVGVFVAVVGLADFLTHSAVSRALHTSTYALEPNGFREESVHSIFPQPGEYSLFMGLLFALTFARFAGEQRRSDLMLALLFAGSAVLSLRLKGILSLAAVVLIVALVQVMADNRGALAILLVGALLGIGAYSVEGNVIAKQVSKYSSSTTVPRARLYATGEQIASANFPLGVGFGRFASYPSRIYYSPVYYQYGLSSVYGLSPSTPLFIDDTSWPSVIGETGYGGFAIYLLGIMLVILAVISRLRTAPASVKWIPLSALCMMAVVLVASLGGPILFDWLATTSVAMILGLVLIAFRPAPEEPGLRGPVGAGLGVLGGQ